MRSLERPVSLQCKVREGRAGLGGRAGRAKAKGASLHIPMNLAREAGMMMFTQQCWDEKEREKGKKWK